MKCKFCDREMVKDYLSSGHEIFGCKNHEVLYLEMQYCTFFGKDGLCFFVRKNSDDVFLVRNVEKPFYMEHFNCIYYFKGMMYIDCRYDILIKTKSIDVDIYNFDKVVEKLSKFKAFL